MSVDINKPLPEDAEIGAAHPLKTGRHDLFAEAYRLVGAKHTKAALAELVNWLLSRIDASEERAQSAEDELKSERGRYDTMHKEYTESLAESWETAKLLTPLAEEGRKAVRTEINDLIDVDDNLPDEYWRCSHTLGKCLSDKGRERLAYLRGLAGEEAVLVAAWRMRGRG